MCFSFPFDLYRLHAVAILIDPTLFALLHENIFGLAPSGSEPGPMYRALTVLSFVVSYPLAAFPRAAALVVALELSREDLAEAVGSAWSGSSACGDGDRTATPKEEDTREGEGDGEASEAASTVEYVASAREECEFETAQELIELALSDGHPPPARGLAALGLAPARSGSSSGIFASLLSPQTPPKVPATPVLLPPSLWDSLRRLFSPRRSWASLRGAVGRARPRFASAALAETAAALVTVPAQATSVFALALPLSLSALVFSGAVCVVSAAEGRLGPAASLRRTWELSRSVPLAWKLSLCYLSLATLRRGVELVRSLAIVSIPRRAYLQLQEFPALVVLLGAAAAFFAAALAELFPLAAYRAALRNADRAAAPWIPEKKAGETQEEALVAKVEAIEDKAE